MVEVRSSTAVVIQGFTIVPSQGSKTEAGIWFKFNCYNCSIIHNMITDFTDAISGSGNLKYGIILQSSSNNSIVGNDITSNEDFGIHLGTHNSIGSHNNQIYGNNITDSQCGISINYSLNNTLYHNNFIDNTNQAYDTSPSSNDWHHPTLLEGNYWSDYTGTDNGSGAEKHAIAGDGIGDTLIPHPNTDYDFYPLMNPWPEHDNIPPEMNILSPENTTYTASSVPLTFTISEPASWIGYSLDGQANVTITGNDTLTSLSNGVHYITVYVNDTAGNMGYSDIVFFTVSVSITGTLTVTTSPVAGAVFVDGLSWGIAPQSRVVEVGTYSVSFGSVEGYSTPSDELATVYENQETVVKGVYQEIPSATGALRVITTPVPGEVFVNGSSWGLAPPSTVVDIGTYNVSFGFVAGYYTPAWQLVTVSESLETTVIGIYESIPGAIGGTITDAFTGLPIAGTTVTADGYSAKTDSTGYYIITDLLAGTYTMTAQATGYYSDTKISIVVESGDTTTVNFTLSLVVGWIDGYVTEIDTGAALVGATVAANSVSTITDADGYYRIELVPRDYTVTAAASGYDDKSKTATVTGEATTILNFTLTLIPLTGTLSVTTTPVIGEVFVNGTSWGVAPQSRVVQIGTYIVTFGDVEGYHTPADHVASVSENVETLIEGVYEPKAPLPTQLQVMAIASFVIIAGVLVLAIYIRRRKTPITHRNQRL